ncbi:hypothetical protein H8356DRAFT_1336059 [Neocallimastix lanati (nom. inval.)]|nr:hypothetical protein H8356DRAFT_1336059 [Neocallimastix sp. JGI-2020a]
MPHTLPRELVRIYMGWVILVSLQKGKIRNWRSTRRSSISKILSNNMDVRAPILKYLVRLSNRDNSAFIKRKWGRAETNGGMHQK